MFKTYTLYDQTTFEHQGIITCPEDLIDLQVEGTNNAFVEGAFDASVYKATANGFIELTTDEITNKLYELRKNLLPPGLEFSLTDEEFNICISDYFFNRIDPTEWRISNYVALRKMFYSNLSDRADAAVKIASGDENLIAEGEAQLAELNANDLAVKTRFPKE